MPFELLPYFLTYYYFDDLQASEYITNITGMYPLIESQTLVKHHLYNVTNLATLVGGAHLERQNFKVKPPTLLLSRPTILPLLLSFPSLCPYPFPSSLI